MYAHQVWVGEAIQLDPLRALTPFALKNLTVEGTYDVTAELFTDVMTNFSMFLTVDDYVSLSTILSSASARSYTAALKGGDFDTDSITFAKLLFAYGDSSVHDLAMKFDDANHRQILSQLVELLACDAYVGAEDEVCSLCLEFWTTFTEFLVDSVFTAGEKLPPWMENARQYIPEVIKACWNKIRMPPLEIFTKWDSTARDVFREFRSDVKDLLQSSYALLGISIFDELAQLALESLGNRAWLHLEATLFCLNALSDDVSEENSLDGILSKLFGSTLFDTMMDSNSVPTATKQTAVNIIIHFTGFFERRTEYLPSMLRFLFESLKIPTLASVAAKAIQSSCWECRKQLVPEIGAFLHQYDILVAWEGVEVGTKEKVIGAIAAIIQALPSDEERIRPLDTLLQYVERDVQACVDSTKQHRVEEAQTHGVCALRCLVHIGKAFQSPNDVPIDLDAKVIQSSFWIGGKGESTQAQIIHLMDIVTTLLRNDSNVIEAACQILRTGYKESLPGPFVFSPSITKNFVVASHLSTARLDYILDTAGALLSRHATSPVAEVDNAALAFLDHVVDLINAMGGKWTDFFSSRWNRI